MASIDNPSDTGGRLIAASIHVERARHRGIDELARHGRALPGGGAGQNM